MGSQDTAEVRRLANAPAGESYKLEVVDGLSERAAHAQAEVWWESGGTIAVVVKNNGQEDSRYEREHMDSDRVPNGWELRKADPRLKKANWIEVIERAVAAAAKAKPEAPPTIFNEEAVPEPPTEPQRGQTIYLCATCKRERTDWEGDDDPTPSGRLNNFRCPECGSPLQGLTHRQIHEAYLRAQSAQAVIEQRAKVIVNKGR
jgi:DNA-directed RNA polymerase subunit RPC12/RpoP